MGCEFSVHLPPTFPDALPAAQAAFDKIHCLEDLLSVYRETSGISQVNREAARRPVRVDDQLFELLKRSAALSEQTEGAFDVSAGGLVRAWGFLTGPRRVPSTSDLQTALAGTGMRHIELDDRTRTIRFRVAGLEINLGSIGKGYAIDAALRRMRDDFHVECALIQGGLSSVRGVGSPARDGRGWLVGIQDPADPTRRVAMVRLRGRALATSGSARQYFEAGGRRYGHVLDPRTGWPADELASASVLAPDAATADALSTALFVMGLDRAADFCHHHADIAALLVLKHPPGCRGRRPPPVVTFNLSADDVEVGPGPQ